VNVVMELGVLAPRKYLVIKYGKYFDWMRNKQSTKKHINQRLVNFPSKYMNARDRLTQTCN
jgi:hypothetical protein